MANGYYNHGNLPGDNTPGSSAEIRAEFDAVNAGFDKIAPVTGNANKVVVINAAETGQTVKTAAALVADMIHAATEKTTPVDTDELPIADSAATYGPKKVTFANLGAWIWSKLGALIAAGTAKTTPVGADSLAISDSAASGATKKITFTDMLNWFAAKLGNASNVFSVATPTNTNHAVNAGFSAPISAELGADVALNNAANYFTGPSVAQGSSGTWFVSGTVTVRDTAGAAAFHARLTDGTTVIASTQADSAAVSATESITLSGYIASPAGNLRIEVRDVTSTSGAILFNATGNSLDSRITAIKIGI